MSKWELRDEYKEIFNDLSSDEKPRIEYYLDKEPSYLMAHYYEKVETWANKSELIGVAIPERQKIGHDVNIEYGDCEYHKYDLFDGNDMIEFAEFYLREKFIVDVRDGLRKFIASKKQDK